MLSKKLSSTLLTKQIAKSFSLWSHVPASPPDSILGLLEKFKDCKDPRKVNLTAGAYRCENGKPWILPSVRLAIDKFNKSDYNLEYIPINGNRSFIDAALGLAYGDGHRVLTNKRVASVQTMSGCGAIYVGYQFLKEWGKSNVIYYSNPTWPIQQSMGDF